MPKVNYQIIESAVSPILEQIINKFLESGWELVGGPFVSQHLYCQAIVWDATADNPNGIVPIWPKGDMMFTMSGDSVTGIVKSFSIGIDDAAPDSDKTSVDLSHPESRSGNAGATKKGTKKKGSK